MVGIGDWLYSPFSWTGGIWWLTGPGEIMPEHVKSVLEKARGADFCVLS